MNASAWNAIGLILAGLISFAVSRLTARANNRKTEAEARMLELQAQELITKGLERGLAQRDKQIARQDKQIDDFSRRLQTMESDLQDAREQTDITQEELDEERKANGLLRVALETAQAHLVAALAELANAKEQIKILVEHAKRVDDWWQVHYSTNGHTNDMDKPPTLTPFDVDGEGA